MGQLSQGVILVHELGKLRRAEEFTNHGSNGTDVDQCLRGQLLVILGGHSLLDDLIHTREANAQLILQLLAHGTDATVAQVVNIVNSTDVVCKGQNIVNGSKDIVLGNVLGCGLVGVPAQ